MNRKNRPVEEIAGKLVRPGIAGLAPYRPGKPLEVLMAEKGLARAVKMASNENPLPPPESARRAMAATAAGLNRYPEGGGSSLRKAIAGFYGIGSDEVILGSGSSEILAMVLQAFLGPGEKVLMPEPGFLIYPVLTLVCGGIPVKVPLAEDFSYDLDRFREAIDEKTRFVFLCSPNNPTGTIVPRRELVAFARDLPGEVILVLDEAYAEYAGSPEFCSGLEFLRERPVLVARTFSKVYGLAGLRIGYGLADASLVAQLNRIRPPFNTTSPAQAAAEAVLADREYREKSLALNRQGKEFLYRELRRLGIAFVKSEANFILLDLLADAPGICALMEDRGVIVRPVDNEALRERYARVTVGTMEENRFFVDALAEILGPERDRPPG